jgi:hypothetical protein
MKIQCNYSENECQEIVNSGSLSGHMKQSHNNYESEMDENEPIGEEINEQERQPPSYNFFDYILKDIFFIPIFIFTIVLSLLLVKKTF